MFFLFVEPLALGDILIRFFKTRLLNLFSEYLSMAGRSQFDSTLTFNLIKFVDSQIQPMSDDMRKRFRLKFDSLLLKSDAKNSHHHRLSNETLDLIPTETERRRGTHTMDPYLFDIASLQRELKLSSPINTERGHLLTTETNQIQMEIEDRDSLSSNY